MKPKKSKLQPPSQKVINTATILSQMDAPVSVEQAKAQVKEHLEESKIEMSKPSLAQNVLSRLSSKLPSSAPVIPRGTPIK